MDVKKMADLIVGIFLLINTGCDLKRKEIPLWSILIFGGIGIILVFFRDTAELMSYIGGLLTGLLVIGTAAATKETVGYGDGMIVAVCGIYLGFFRTFFVLFYGLLLCAVVSAVLVVMKKRTGKTRVPFLPYLLFGYVCLSLT